MTEQMIDYNRFNTNCVSCLGLNEESAEYCEVCGLPLGPTAALDPIKIIQSQGILLSKAVTQRPKFIVLLGIWILFFPGLIGNLFLIFHEMTNGKELSDFVFVCFGAALAGISGSFLFLVTRNYLTMPELRLKTNAKSTRRQRPIRLKATQQSNQF